MVERRVEVTIQQPRDQHILTKKATQGARDKEERRRVRVGKRQRREEGNRSQSTLNLFYTEGRIARTEYEVRKGKVRPEYPNILVASTLR